MLKDSKTSFQIEGKFEFLISNYRITSSHFANENYEKWLDKFF